MFKHHKYASIIIGLLYVLVLQAFSTPQPIFRFLAPAFLLLCALAFYYNKAYLQLLKKYNFWVVLRPLLLFVSGFGIFFLLPTPGFRILFLASTFLLIALAEVTLGNFAENLLLDETLIIAFGFFISLTAFEQYFPYFKDMSLQPIYLLGVFLCVSALARAFYEFIPQTNKTKWVGAVALGLLCAELFWTLSFLPFHYSTQAVILLCVFYFCLILNYYHLFHTLTLKKIQFHLVLIILACGLAILSTPWKVLN